MIPEVLGKEIPGLLGLMTIQMLVRLTPLKARVVLVEKDLETLQC